MHFFLNYKWCKALNRNDFQQLLKISFLEMYTKMMIKWCEIIFATLQAIGLKFSITSNICYTNSYTKQKSRSIAETVSILVCHRCKCMHIYNTICQIKFTFSLFQVLMIYTIIIKLVLSYCHYLCITMNILFKENLHTTTLCKSWANYTNRRSNKQMIKKNTHQKNSGVAHLGLEADSHF